MTARTRLCAFWRALAAQGAAGTAPSRPAHHAHLLPHHQRPPAPHPRRQPGAGHPARAPQRMGANPRACPAHNPRPCGAPDDAGAQRTGGARSARLRQRILRTGLAHPVKPPRPKGRGFLGRYAKFCPFSLPTSRNPYVQLQPTSPCRDSRSHRAARPQGRRDPDDLSAAADRHSRLERRLGCGAPSPAMHRWVLGNLGQGGPAPHGPDDGGMGRPAHHDAR